MYVILFYDIADRSLKERDNSRRIRKAVEKYLSRVQFSVFEGEIRESDLKKLKAYLRKHVHKELDSIVIYESTKVSYTDRIVIGIDKNETLFS
ncbi:CRISPR-associated endonuclease Cas2 [Nitratifractor salsuginis]|uniref:CRISPR-associated endoribonuclease Cas2 n=1 Tax=Nitratifractor salsuginis (strain DSM 16511 / JCM 12458 / E9I37-1) TaxID=749222 RepID=E6WXQ6_NITSE|nr:CRISPR-associated endonuclease Cas2 [Nitratifractor salsuginis]ADV46313.1 CRISPR-associated protein, Cas2 family [Nitratifractor salsuginis DSM 16511]